MTRIVLLVAMVLTGGLAAGTAFPARAAEPPAANPRNLNDLTILGPNYPRVFFFRAAEGGPSRPAVRYEEWDAEFSRLMGIMGKCLDEEVLGRERRNPEFFSRFKHDHPQQVVLLHLNGNSRDPRYHTERYSAGHWIYRRATTITADVPAEMGQTEIQVRDARDFKIETGRYKTSQDDIGLFGITAEGKHDWNYCEQVQLTAVDLRTNTIRVKRGCYGTKPLAFRAGQSRAAAHMVEGPWGKNNNLLWFYNFSRFCPRDAQGRTCADLLVDDLAAWFGPGGKLAAFDGLEFDVFFHETHGDTDGDGELDNGVVAGLNQYGIGTVEFARQLRARMGDSFILQGDGALGPGGARSQRAFGLLNGIESEGWPNLNQWEMDDWSGGLNRQSFWQDNARPPAFNYINHKWVEPLPGRPGEHKNPEVSPARHRLVFAAAQFTDAMLCYSFPPRAENGRIGIWDEFRCGTANRLGWLGRPEDAAIHLAATTANLVPSADLSERIRGDVEVRETAGSLVLTPKNPQASAVDFSIPDIPTDGSDLVVLVTLKGEPLRGYPREVARFAQVEVSGGARSLVGGDPDEVGMALRGQRETPLDAETGARVQYRPRETIGARTMAGYAIHPPYQGGKGYVYWCREVEVPEAAELRFSLEMSERSPSRSDGVWFQVWVAEVVQGRPGDYERVFEQTTKAHEWLPCTVPLTAWAKKRVRLKFVGDCGPQDNATTDQGFWGDVRLGIAGITEAADTPAKSYMTWVNDRSFTSSFYFREVNSAQVNLAFRIEGREPVTLEKISVHAHPDSMVRLFEHGLVLANPSPQPYTFDLSKISPGRRYRRLAGSPSQDPATNNGQPVDARVTLAAKDALFLANEGLVPIAAESNP